MKYATETSVSVGKSRGEIEDLVQRAGGDRFATFTEKDRAIIIFELAARRVMFELPLPARAAFATRKVRSRIVDVEPARQQRDWEQACRTHWRALALAIKAKLVSVEAGVETFEEAFLAHIVVQGENGKSTRFADFAVKAIQQAYTGKPLPPLLGAGS